MSTSKMLFFLLQLILIAYCQAEGNGEEGRYTAYACEGRQLNIACESSNYVVHLLRANYGRFSISICNEHGNLDWSVACTSAASFYVIKDACGLKNNCTLSATPALFGDPCPGTPKYLEAHYQCIPEKSSGAPLTSTMVSTSSTTSTSRPPIIIPVTRNVRPYMPAIVTDDMRTPSSQMTPSSTTDTDDVPTTEELPPTTYPTTSASADFSSSEQAVDNALVITGLPESSTSEPSTVHQSRWSPGSNLEDDDPQGSGLWCGPAQSRGLYWNWTRAGHVAIHKCPGGGIGRVKWRCDMVSVQWTPDSPDFSDCTSLWVDNIKYRISRGDSVTTLAAELAVITRTKSLMPGDIVHTAEILHKLVGEMGERTRDVDDPQRRQRLLLALLEAVLEVSSNLLEDSQRLPWNDLNTEQQQKSAAALLRSQEKSGWLLAESHHSRYNLRNGQRHVLAAVHVVESWDISDLVLPPPVDTTWWGGVEDRLLVPAPSLLATAKQGISRLVLLVHSRLGDFLGTEVRRTVAPLSNLSNLSRIVNSRVIGALLEGHRVLSLPRPITVTFKHLQVENVSDPMCVFWDYQLRSWSTEGCWLKYSNRTHTVCQCSHLTNLAIIMHISETQDQPLSSDQVTLRMLVYIGCAVAMIFLLVTILILQFVRCIRTERISIHKHLCLCLLLAEAAVVGGLEQAEEPKACSVLAGLLHYLLLAAFAWAFLDSFHLYIFLRDSELQPLMWRMKWYTIVAYGIPLVVVTVSAIIDPASYGTDTYCWLRVDNYYVFSFGGPAIACALASVLFLCLTIARVCAQRNSTIPVKSKDQTKLSTVSKWSGEATILLLILCSTWTLLPLFLHRERPLTAYFFLGLNSLQGLLVFLFYCIDGDKVPGAEEPPGPVWLCSCLRQAPRRRNHHLYSPTSTSNCHLHNPQQHHHNHQANSYPLMMWHPVNQEDEQTPPLPITPTERRCGSDSCEEHPLQYLLPHDNQQPQQQYHSDNQHQWGCTRNERGLCCYRGPRNASPQIQEPHYETLEPQDVLIIGEEDIMEADIPPPRPLLSSLAARLSHSSHHSHPSPCHVAYSGIQSPTDSDRSSSLDGLQPMSRLAPSTPSSAGNDVTDSLPDLDRTRAGPTGIPASLTY